MNKLFVRLINKIKREVNNLYAYLWVPFYVILNRVSSVRVVSDVGDPSNLVVSLTSYGKRVTTVFVTIESIARGALLPGRFILWLDDERIYRKLPKSLLRLQQRGLEIYLCENYGPHTKYFPSLFLDEPANLLVTADDDIIYPKYWLEQLYLQFRKTPKEIVCYRAHRINFLGDRFSPYREWAPCLTRSASYLNFATGVSGVIYSREFLDYIKGFGTEFLRCAPKADDVWLYFLAIKFGTKIRQIYRRPRHFLIYPGSQTEALFLKNGFDGGNDKQIISTFSDGDFEFLKNIFDQDPEKF